MHKLQKLTKCTFLNITAADYGLKVGHSFTILSTLIAVLQKENKVSRSGDLENVR